MADLLNTTQTAATERDIGTLHERVTTLMISKTDLMLEELEASKTLEDKQYSINMQDLTAMGRWVTANGVGALASSEEKGNELREQLEKIRAKNRKRVTSVGDTNG